MFNTNSCYLVVGALFLVNFTIVFAAACEGCKADSLIDLIDKLDAKMGCWISTEYQFIVKQELVALEEINDNLVVLHESINQVVADKCRTEVQLKSCPMTDKYELSQCLMDNQKTLAYNYRDQEKCHGKNFNLKILHLLFRELSAYLEAMIEILPEC